MTPAQSLLGWYDRHARHLPWRIPPQQSKRGERQDPYKVWLSEIMLQQTTVQAVAPYYAAFIERWPTVGDLAKASDDDIRSAWAGLGYYRRAANLHKCAKVVAETGGHFPTTAAQLADLPGIGAYTSAAIASIAFGEAVPVVDGNVERVFSRVFRLTSSGPKLKKEVTDKLRPLVPRDRPGDFAQATMDLGATICTPRNPVCALCPLTSTCDAHRYGDAERFPVKEPKKAKPVRFGAAQVIVRPADGAIWCEKRPEDGLLPGMTQVPTSDWSASPAPVFDGERIGTIQHVFTHFALTLDVYRVASSKAPSDGGWWAGPEQIAKQAWPTVMIKVLRAALPERAESLRGGKGR
ncbi:MAG: A/G-specific adenine glycosylase [Pseudomonadota bacterium]